VSHARSISSNGATPRYTNVQFWIYKLIIHFINSAAFNSEDVNSGGAVPYPWDIPVYPDSLFVNQQKIVDIPNTAYITVTKQ
jgi:hypothetical protein